MTLGRTPTGAIKIKTDSPGLRAVECACCGGGGDICPCQGIVSGIVLTEQEYNNFKQGGNYTMTANLSENYNQYSCSSNLNGSGTLSANCNYGAIVSEPKCSDPNLYNSSFLSVLWNVCKEESTGLYKLHYAGAAACPYDFFGQCYSVGYFINEEWDYSGSSFAVPVGTVTITNRGSQVQFNVWSFPPSSGFSVSANGSITITPLIP